MGCVESSSSYNSDILYKNAANNYKARISSYNYYLHGDYDSYVYKVQAEYEYECLSPAVTRGSAVNSRFNDF